MRILHLVQSLGFGGMESLVTGLAGHQRRSGLSPEIALLEPTNEYADFLSGAGVSVRSFTRKGPLDPHLIASLHRLLRESGIEVLHCHNETAAVYGALALGIGRPCPMILTLHNGARGRLPWLRRLEFLFAYRRANRIACVSSGIAQHVVEHEGAPAGRVTTVYNGAGLPAPPSAEELQGLRDLLDIDPGRRVVLAVGRLDPVKNHAGILRAFAQARLAIPDLLFLLAGDGPLLDVLRRLTQDLGLQDHVRFLGSRKDVPSLLALADVYVQPSFAEGHSIALLEACASGKAILASDRGGNPQIVRDGESALLVDPEDTDGMAAALLRLATDADLRQRLGKTAYQDFGGRFSIEACHRAYLSLYESL